MSRNGHDEHGTKVQTNEERDTTEGLHADTYTSPSIRTLITMSSYCEEMDPKGIEPLTSRL